MIKTLQKADIDGTYLNKIKATYYKLTANIILSGKKNESIPLNIRNKTRMSTFTTIIQHSFGSLSYSNQRRKRNKRNPDGKRRRKLSLFADDMIFYISSVQFSRITVVSDSLRPHESQHARPPCPSPTPGVHSDSRPSSP